MEARGIILGEGWADGSGKKYADCMVWGTLTLDAKEICLKKPKVEFRVRYRRKQFLHCVVWEESPFYEQARKLRMGDWVYITGTYTKTQYSTRNGVLKERYELTAGFLIPGTAIYDEGALTAHKMARFKGPDPFYSGEGRAAAKGEEPDF